MAESSSTNCVRNGNGTKVILLYRCIQDTVFFQKIETLLKRWMQLESSLSDQEHWQLMQWVTKLSQSKLLLKLMLTPFPALMELLKLLKMLYKLLMKLGTLS